MHKRPTTLFAFLVLAGSAGAADATVADPTATNANSATAAFAIPVTKTATTKALGGWEPIKHRRAFYRASFVDAYQAHGHHDGAWDEFAVKYLDICARDRGEYESTIRMLPARKAAGEAVIAAGCDDPLVCYLRGRDLEEFDHPADGSNPRWGTDAEQSALYAKVYPAIRDLGYTGFSRFMAAHSLIFQKGNIDEATRQQQLPAEQAARFDWLKDPVVIAYPDIISAWMYSPYHVHGDDATITAYWQGLAQTPAAWPEATRWMVDLVNGIAHLYLAHGYDLLMQGVGPETAAQLDQTVDHDQVRQAVACLEEARRRNPDDSQAIDWLIALAVLDSSVKVDPPKLLGESMTIDAGTNHDLAFYSWWLDVRHPGDVGATAEFIDAMSRQALFGTSLPDSQINTAFGFAARYPERAGELLHRPDVYSALAEAHYWAVRPRWMSPGDYRGCQATWAILLWKMGDMAEARYIANSLTDDDLTPNLQWRLGIPVVDFRAAMSADANVKLLDQANSLSSHDATAAAAMLEQAAASDQAFLLDSYAVSLAEAGRKAESIALTDRTIARFGRQSRDALVFMDALLPPASAQDIALAFAHLGAHPDQMFVTTYAEYICNLVRKDGLQDRYLALVQPWMYNNNFSFDLDTAWVLLDTIDGATKAAELEHRLTSQTGLVNARWLAHNLAVQTLAARLSHRPDLEPGADELRAQVGQPHDLDTGDALMAFLAGDADRAATLAQAQTVGKNADEIYYYLALDDLVHGDREQARSDLQHLLAHPTWDEVGEATCMLSHFNAAILSSTTAATAPPVTRTPAPPMTQTPDTPAGGDAPAAKPSDF